MIKSLQLTYFRQHEDLHLSFTEGLQVLRGSNESGKSTVQESILYALYGSKALRNSLSDTTTWGHKESELKVKLEIEVSGVTYTFTRSKAGAECSFNGLLITGQNEVTAHAANILGADAKTASSLMLADQSGLRGALDDGPTAVSGLMGKLAGFDQIDQIIERMQSKLLLGNETPFREKLAAAEAEVAAAEALLPSPTAVSDAELQVATLKSNLKTLEDHRTKNEDVAYNNAFDAYRDAKSRQEKHEAAVVAVADAQGKKETAERNLAAAKAKAADKVNPARIDELRKEIAGVAERQKVRSAYALFEKLPAYPEIFWEGTEQEFSERLKEITDSARELDATLAEVRSEIRLKESQLVKGGVCPACGTDISKRQDVVEKNAALEGEIAGFKGALEKGEALKKTLAAKLASFNEVKVGAVAYINACRKVGDYLNYDENFYPPKVSWAGEIPNPDDIDVNQFEEKLAALESKANEVARAEGAVVAYAAAAADAIDNLKKAEAAVALNPSVELTSYEAAFRKASDDHTRIGDRIYDAQQKFEKANTELVRLKAEQKEAKQRYDTAAARVNEYSEDIKALGVNNALLKKMRAIKPQITDYLWSTVLAAVSNFFTDLRGENSVVTKDSSGFRVNGHSMSSLSGSTLDILAIAVRVALTKTFIPHTNLLILDEPAYGADLERTASILGFLSSVGFNQIIVASHDELSESVADNVITLGG